MRLYGEPCARMMTFSGLVIWGRGFGTELAKGGLEAAAYVITDPKLSSL